MGELRAAAQLPAYPAACRVHHHSGVKAVDDARAGLEKTDIALVAQWGQTDNCAAWYDHLRVRLAQGA